MSSRPTRTTLVLLGVVALLIGGLWVGQGLNLVPGSFMTGNKMWFWIGLVVGLVGLVLVVLGVTRRTRTPVDGAPQG